MKRFRHRHAGNRPLVFFGTLLLLTAWAFAALAEGSRELNPNGSNRAYAEWMGDNNTYSTGSVQPGGAEDKLYRRQIVKAYVMEGETVCFGSSVYNATTKLDSPASDPTVRDIGVCVPGETSLRYYDVQPTGKGYISTRAMEVNGPRQVSAGGYDAFSITAAAGTPFPPGVYRFEFYSRGNSYPAVADQNPSPKRVVLADANWTSTGVEQRGCIAAWDITVIDVSGNEVRGRAFTDYLSLNAVDHQRSIDSEVYILTADGYQYETDFNGLQPYGMMFFANNRGLLKGLSDPAATKSFYHSGIYTDEHCNKLEGGIGFVLPDDEVTDGPNLTYRIFFNEPNREYLEYIGLAEAAAPLEPANFHFNYGNAVSSGAGGTFAFDCAREPIFFSMYQIEIRCSPTDPNNRVYLSDRCRKGTNRITWNGRDINGDVVPIGNYTATLVVKSGEYHFPFADIEGNPNGIKITLINTPGGPDPSNDSRVYYDNSDITVGGVPLDFQTGWNASWGSRTQLDGVLSSGGALKYSYPYGDRKLMDVWTYYKSQANTASTTVRITDVGSLTISKTVTGAAPLPEDTFTFTLYNGTSPVSSFAYTVNGGPARLATVGGSFALKNGETATIASLEAKGGYAVAETQPGSAAGTYATEYSVDGAPLSGGLTTGVFSIVKQTTPRAVAFTNAYTANPPVPPATGDGANPRLWLALAAGAVIIGATLGVSVKKRKSGSAR